MDLNALVYMNYCALGEFHSLLGDEGRAEEYSGRACALREAVGRVLWHEEDGVWYDFDLVNEVSGIVDTIMFIAVPNLCQKMRKKSTGLSSGKLFASDLHLGYPKYVNILN